MIGVNKVTLLGNLGADPETKKTASGQSITLFSLATSNVWTNRDGQRQEHTEWHRIVVWGRLAETCAEYLSKGRKAYVEGRLQTRSWEDDKGQKKYTTEVVAFQVLFLNGSPEKRTSSTSSYATEPAFGSESSASSDNNNSTTETSSDNNNSTAETSSDIPF